MPGLRDQLPPLGKQVVTLRDKEGKQWLDIGQELEIAPGKAMQAYEVASLSPGDIFTAKTEAALAKEVQRLRDKDRISWAKIAAKVDTAESTCRGLYDPEGRGRGDRIGKGGRYPSDAAPAKAASPAKAARTTKKAAAAKATGPKVEKKQVLLTAMNSTQLTTRLTGKRIKVALDENGSKSRSMIVKEVLNLTGKNGDVTFADGRGKEHTYPVSQIMDAAA